MKSVITRLTVSIHRKSVDDVIETFVYYLSVTTDGQVGVLEMFRLTKTINLPIIVQLPLVDN